MRWTLVLINRWGYVVQHLPDRLERDVIPHLVCCLDCEDEILTSAKEHPEPIDPPKTKRFSHFRLAFANKRRMLAYYEEE